MDLTQDEKDRILAEERYRLEAKNQLAPNHPCCRGSWPSQEGFWKGFLLGVALCVILGMAVRHSHRRMGPGFGQGYGQNQQGHFQRHSWGPQNQSQDQDDQR